MRSFVSENETAIRGEVQGDPAVERTAPLHRPRCIQMIVSAPATDWLQRRTIIRTFTPLENFFMDGLDQRWCVAFVVVRPVDRMNQRWLAGFMQAFLLGAAVVLASRDVERTMHQQPVRPEQNAALLEYFEKRQQQQQRP
jgi:hypothetical protein